ncbi:MAG: hypothetical protein AAF394_13400 [Planctomycetota bacterium]
MGERITLHGTSELESNCPKSWRKKQLRGAAFYILCHLVGTLIFSTSCVAPTENGASLAGARFDHVVVFAEDESLRDWLRVHLTPAEALETRHEGQGTRGRYFLFLNSFLEVLTLADAAEARSNEKAFGSPYVARWQDKNAAPVAFGLSLDTNSFASPPFGHVRYQKDEEGGGYVMANGNVNLLAPLVYATGPDRAYPRRASMEELNTIEDAGRREEVRQYLTHSCGAKTLTQVIWRSPVSGSQGPNAELMRKFPEVTFERGLEYELVLEFDNATSGREVRYQGRPSVVLRF